MEGARLWDRSKESGEDVAKAVWRDVESLAKHDIAVEDPNPTTHSETNPLQKDHHSQTEVEAIATHLKRSLEGVVIEIFRRAREATQSAASVSAQPYEALRMRWVPAYFPFTSPSWELEVFWEGDWLELLGCGVVRQDLLINSQVPHKLGWAFGVGLERIAMLLFAIPDIRLFWSRDPRFLSQFSPTGPLSRFVSFSKHPACYKDVAFWLGSSSGAGGGGRGSVPSFHENDVMEIVRDVAGDVVEDVVLVDEFTHPGTGRKSLCYRINYRSLERTLKNEEANQFHDAVRSRLVEKLDVELR